MRQAALRRQAGGRVPAVLRQAFEHARRDAAALGRHSAPALHRPRTRRRPSRCRAGRVCPWPDRTTSLASPDVRPGRHRCRSAGLLERTATVPRPQTKKAQPASFAWVPALGLSYRWAGILIIWSGCCRRPDQRRWPSYFGVVPIPVIRLHGDEAQRKEPRTADGSSRQLSCQRIAATQITSRTVASRKSCRTAGRNPRRAARNSRPGPRWPWLRSAITSLVLGIFI